MTKNLLIGPLCTL